MYKAKHSLLIGFHGCDAALRDQVLLGKETLTPSANEYDWLGEGIYFWENNPTRALAFAQELNTKPHKGKPAVDEPAVLGAVIDLGRCLDLLDSAYLGMLKDEFVLLNRSAVANDLTLPDNKSVGGSQDLLLRNLDCAVINSLHRRLPGQFDSVRGVFIEGEPVYVNAGFHEKTHIQLCVRNPNCIKGYFLPRAQNDHWPSV